MNRARLYPNPIPYQYGYPHRSTGELNYNRPAPRFLVDDNDHFFDTRGEGAYYYDSQLGRAPTKRGFFQRLGLRDPVSVAPYAPPASTNDVVAQLNAHNDRIFALTMVSTAAVAVSALLTVFRTLKLIARD